MIQRKPIVFNEWFHETMKSKQKSKNQKWELVSPSSNARTILFGSSNTRCTSNVLATQSIHDNLHHIIHGTTLPGGLTSHSFLLYACLCLWPGPCLCLFPCPSVGTGCPWTKTAGWVQTVHEFIAVLSPGVGARHSSLANLAFRNHRRSQLPLGSSRRGSTTAPLRRKWALSRAGLPSPHQAQTPNHPNQRR